MNLCHVPCGISSSQLLHFFDEVKYGYFGPRMKGTKVPCDFPFHKITAPVIIHRSLTDYVADPIDIKRFISKLTCVKDLYINTITKSFGHIDPSWGIHADPFIYTPTKVFFKKHC